jgi:hypothetical protein
MQLKDAMTKPDSPAKAQLISPHRSPSWLQTWLIAVVRPSLEVYKLIAANPKASLWRGILWVFLASLVGMLIGLPLTRLLSQPHGARMAVEFQSILINFDLFIIAAPLAALFQTLFVFTASSMIHWFAHLSGGQGSYKRLVYTQAAFSAPLWLIVDILLAVPLVGTWIFILQAIYFTFLSVIAVKAVHGLGTGKAITAVLATMALTVVIITYPIWMGFRFY